MALRERLHELVFEADTKAGRTFDLVLLALIVGSVAAICVESVPDIGRDHRALLRALEWLFTGLLTVEYVVRLYCVRRPLGNVRILRLVRVFRVLKIVHFLGEASVLRAALRASLPKITVFLLAVACLIVVVGSAMYVIEGADNGFDSIPHSIYWAVVTLTTVGYGDIAPRTVPGQTLASFVMLLGYGILAVPTGIVAAEMVRRPVRTSTQHYPHCSGQGHADDAKFCRLCGGVL